MCVCGVCIHVRVQGRAAGSEERLSKAPVVSTALQSAPSPDVTWANPWVASMAPVKKQPARAGASLSLLPLQRMQRCMFLLVIIYLIGHWAVWDLCAHVIKAVPAKEHIIGNVLMCTRHGFQQ